ncbi:ORF5 [Lymantria xylina nucleopolyhedrovirus]|uniref:ORF5 n=1 Tax=Lymantria xylina multiple nucleopolyhedrovirus TaxID=2847840 RepID=D4N242_9ABAC|nr:ORF5 [Lymantria xylina nucleopolyhedrovirus]ADD73714.1 ORF5 [Lymantria xylina nucleopolyhedrovirus]
MFQTLLHLSRTMLLHVFEDLVGDPVAQSVLQKVDSHKLNIPRVFQHGQYVAVLAFVQGNVNVYFFHYFVIVKPDLLPFGVLATSVQTFHGNNFLKTIARSRRTTLLMLIHILSTRITCLIPNYLSSYLISAPADRFAAARLRTRPRRPSGSLIRRSLSRAPTRVQDNERA